MLYRVHGSRGDGQKVRGSTSVAGTDSTIEKVTAEPQCYPQFNASSRWYEARLSP